MWIGAPGSEGLIGEGKKSPGRAYLYDLKKRKRIKSYKPPKGLTMSFGEAITANEESVWISAPRFSDNHGVICQFSRDKGKRIRTLLPPESGSDQYFGSRMVATNDLLITSSLPVDWPAPIAPGSVHGYSADTGEHLWSIGPGDGTRRGDSLAILPGNILAVGGAGIFFYQLIPGAPPRLIVEATGGTVSQLVLNGDLLAYHRFSIFDENPVRVFNIRDIPQLLPLLGPFPTGGSKTAGLISPLLSQHPDGWKLDLPSHPFDGAVLETSLDLTSWRAIAHETPDSGWLLHADHGLVNPLIANGNSLVLPSETSPRFFRIRVP